MPGIEDHIAGIQSRRIALNEGKFATVDADLFGLLSVLRWKAHFNGRKWYAKAYAPAFEREIFMHRLILGVDAKALVDHKNGDGLDNRRQNLRFATPSQNGLNKAGASRTSKYKGVSLNLETLLWEAHVRVDGRRNKLGPFATESEAALAYNDVASQAHGDFAWLNQVDGAGPQLARPRGRKPAPWRRTDRGGDWFTKIKGRMIRLASGDASYEQACAALVPVLRTFYGATEGFS